MLVCGAKEVEAGMVALRTRKGEDLGQMTLDTFQERLKQKFQNRTLPESSDTPLEEANS